MSRRWRPWLLLSPALLVLLLLFGGGVLLALAQSLGYLPAIGRTTLSLDAYANLFTDQGFWRGLALSLWIAVASTSLATVLALISALALRGATGRWRLATLFFQLNIPIPHMVGAVGILFLFSQSGLLARLAYVAGLIDGPAGFPALVYDRWAVGIILEYVWKSTCFIGLILLAALQGPAADYEAAARTLGAGAWQRLRYVLLPLLLPAIRSASILVFAFTFGAFEVPLLLGQRFPAALPVLAYRNYTDVDLNARPEAMALSIIIAAVAGAAVLLYLRVTGGAGRSDRL